MPLESTSDPEGTAVMLLESTSDPDGTAIMPLESTSDPDGTAVMPLESTSDPDGTAIMSPVARLPRIDTGGPATGSGSGISNARCRSSPSKLTDSPVEWNIAEGPAEPSKVAGGV